jgi:hypothetical protein
VIEPQYRQKTKRIRVFAQSAGVSQRGCSRPLQRVITDFGADVPFAKVMDKLVEHYGIVICESTIRNVTHAHAQKIFERSAGQPLFKVAKSASPGGNSSAKKVIVAQTDGTMVPTVRSDPAQADQRKAKSLQWQEAKVSLAHVKGSKQLAYAATLQGDVDQVGQQLRACAREVGFSPNDQVHAVGDGAPWIAEQVRKQFATQGSYLVDFYHVCDYLVAAAKAIEPGAQQKIWMDKQKGRLKTQRVDQVLNELQPHLEDQEICDADAPVRCCYRYLSNRQDQLDYQSALEQGLPIDPAQINMNFLENFFSKIDGKRKRTKTNTGATARAAQASSEVA